MIKFDLPKIPPRTRMKISIKNNIVSEIMALASEGRQLTLNERHCDKSYECLDCGYETKLYDDIVEHQIHQAAKHTLWQRFRRYFSRGRG